MPETASEKEQLWQLGEARVFDQMTSDQASGGLKHEYYHLQDQHHDPFQMTRPSEWLKDSCCKNILRQDRLGLDKGGVELLQKKKQTKKVEQAVCLR